MKKKVLQVSSIVVVMLFLMMGCAPMQNTPTTSGEVMKVAQYFWPGQFWIDIADSKGWFAEEGLNVELVDTNPNFYQSLQDTVDEKIDYNNFPLYDLVKFNAEGADMVVVINTDISFGADSIIAKKSIERVSDLKGKKIGIGEGTFTDYLLSVVLDRNGIAKDDVTIVEVSAENPAPFIAGDIDAFVTWDPTRTEALEKGDGHVIWDTSQISGILPEGGAFHRSFINERPNDVQAYVNVWHRTTEFIKEYPEEAFQIIADIYDVPVEDVQAFTQDVKILDLRDNKVAFSYAAGFESLHGTARQINDFMKKNEITDKTLDSTKFLDARFIRGVEE
jgi:NitT/TauT family transport system substrate-binding protein